VVSESTVLTNKARIIAEAHMLFHHVLDASELTVAEGGADSRDPSYLGTKKVTSIPFVLILAKSAYPLFLELRL